MHVNNFESVGDELSGAVADVFDIATASVECSVKEILQTGDNNRTKRSVGNDVVVCTCELEDTDHVTEIENMINSTALIQEINKVVNNSLMIKIDGIKIKAVIKDANKNTAGT